MRGLAGVLSSRSGLQRLVVLYFHRVLEEPDPMFPDIPTRQEFDRQMSALAGMFRVLPLGDAVDALAADRLPPAAVAITFDDGYADNFHTALPVLRRYGLPATFFVASAYLDGGVMFNDQVMEACRHLPVGSIDTGLPELGILVLDSDTGRRALAEAVIGKIKYLAPSRRAECAEALLDLAGCASPAGLMMTTDEVAKLSAHEVTVGAHTWSHPILAAVSEDQACTELKKGRQVLQEITGQAVELFAYPNGRPRQDYGPREVSLAQKTGFKAAFSTQWGCADRRWDLWQLPRIAPWDRSGFKFGLRVTRALVDRVQIARANGDGSASGMRAERSEQCGA
ncbi:MAG TPA: polysaccharide deacetylase family protein [Chromatiales bacterium]|nr:polysaccharide deacetylase family protein [Chromatiales bacterium]